MEAPLNRDVTFIMVSLAILFLFLALGSALGSVIQESLGYDIEVTELMKGERFAVSPLSPSTKTAPITLSAKSDDIFLFAGEQEKVAIESAKGFSLESEAVTGEWEVAEGFGITLNIHSDTALKVIVDRGLNYVLPYIFFLFIVFVVIEGIWVWAFYGD